MSADCLPHQVPSSASRFLKGIPAELLEHTCHMELLNKPTARRDTNGANFAQPPPRPPPAHGLPRAGGASDARLASQAAAGGGGALAIGAAALAAGAAALAAGLGSQPVGSQHAMREAISGSQAEGERPAGAVTGAVGAHLARWQQAHARKEHERRARKEKEQTRKAEKEAANEAAAGDGEASGPRAPRAPKAGAVPSSKAAGKARVLPAGDQPPAKRAKSKRIVVDDEDSEDNDLFD